jgi:hypothetical protein
MFLVVPVSSSWKQRHLVLALSSEFLQNQFLILHPKNIGTIRETESGKKMRSFFSKLALFEFSEYIEVSRLFRPEQSFQKK